MSSKPSGPDNESAPHLTWTPLKLRGIPRLGLSHHFDYTEDRQALVLSARIEPGGSILRYGMSQWDLGSAWDEQSSAKRRLKALAEAQIRKDLFLLSEVKRVPRSSLQIEWINFKGRTIA